MPIRYNPLPPQFDRVLTGGASGSVNSLTGNDGVVVNPVSNNINVLGLGTSSSGISTAGNIYTTGAGDNLTVNETQAQFLTNYRQVAVSGNVLPTDFLIGCTASNITLTLEASPGTNRIVVIKDESGTATATPITIAGNGHNINGHATLSLDQDYASFNLYFNGVNWFSY